MFDDELDELFTVVLLRVPLLDEPWRKLLFLLEVVELPELTFPRLFTTLPTPLFTVVVLLRVLFELLPGRKLLLLLLLLLPLLLPLTDSELSTRVFVDIALLRGLLFPVFVVVEPLPGRTVALLKPCDVEPELLRPPP